MVVLTFMMGMGSAPGSPRSSIMFLMSMERSATLRAVMRSQYGEGVRLVKNEGVTYRLWTRHCRS